MLRRLLVITIVLGVWAAFPLDLNACGDKFLRIGRSSRLNGYAAVYPSSIVMLLPGKAKPSAVKEFATALKRAGHTFQAVATLDALSEALAEGQVDIVIAAGEDAARLRPHALSVVSRPEIVPIVHKPSPSALAALQNDYEHVLKLPATKHEALAEIDHVMESRLGRTPANASGN